VRLRNRSFEGGQAPVEHVHRQLEAFERMRVRNDKRVSKNPPGFLVAAIIWLRTSDPPRRIGFIGGH